MVPGRNSRQKSMNVSLRHLPYKTGASSFMDHQQLKINGLDQQSRSKESSSGPFCFRRHYVSLGQSLGDDCVHGRRCRELMLHR